MAKRTARIEIVTAGLSTGRTYWYRIVAANGQVISTSKTYRTAHNARGAARSALQAAHDLSASVTVRGVDPIRDLTRDAS